MVVQIEYVVYTRVSKYDYGVMEILPIEVAVFAGCISGGVTGTLNSELFTQMVRPAACMIGLSVNWISFFIISIIFPFVVVSATVTSS